MTSFNYIKTALLTPMKHCLYSVTVNYLFYIFKMVVLLIIVLWSSFDGWALDPQKAITQYIMNNWQLKEGLPHNSILAIVQTRDGYIWLGTGNGLVRFDGVRFIVFNKRNTEQIKMNVIETLYEDRIGNLWIGTSSGLVCLRDGKFTIYTIEEGLSHDYVKSIYEDRVGNLWIGTKGGGLNRLKDGKFTAYTTEEGLSNNNVKSIYLDREGTLCIGTEGGGLMLLRDEKFTIFTTKDGLSNNYISSLYEDQKGNLWIGTLNGLNKFRDSEFTAFTTKEGMCNNEVNVIYEDREGNLWIGTDGGLNRFKDGEFASLTMKEDLSHNIVCSIYEDREGNLWVGTLDGGLVCLRDGKLSTYSTKEGLSHNFIYSVYEDRVGNIWIGTSNGGLNCLKDGKFTTYTSRDGISTNSNILTILEDRERALWIGTDCGLNRMKEGKFTIYTIKEGLSDDMVRCVYEDQAGNLWIGTHNGGLNRLENGKFINYTTNDGLMSNTITYLHEDKEGALWIGTLGGLNCIKEGKITSYTTKEGLTNNNINTIYGDHEGTLWIGTRCGGLNCLKDGKFTSYSIKDGLFSDVIIHILEDNNNNLWISYNNGIFQVSKKDLNDFTDGKINAIHSTSYGLVDGMRSSSCTGGVQSAGLKSHDGKLWFPTLNGVVMIDPDNIKINKLPPPVIIEEVSVDNMIINPELIKKIDRIVFSPGKERFEFYYTALSFTVPEMVKFKYKLEGFDINWIDTDNRRMAYYMNIPPGDYIFKVIACNNDGVWNTTGASFSFYLKPFFYQTKWFYGLCVVLVFFMGFIGYRLRVRQLKVQKKKLERKVEERTKEIREQKYIIEEKNEQLQKKNEQILSSIRYGECIQNAILPLTEKIRFSIPQHFILYKPRDIVSGDFYWFNQVNGKIVLAVVDCTGHGVPGAFMSMLGNAFLNQIITEQQIMDPSLILTRLHEEVRTALKQEQGEADTQDGMDVCLCVLEKNRHKQKVFFAGAKCPLYIIKKGETEITEIKGDRKSIGGKQREEKQLFTNHEIKVQKGDRLYLTTDGFADQQNSNNRRYGSRRLKIFLQSVSELSMQEQREALVQELASHQGIEEQRDDITVVGVKV